MRKLQIAVGLCLAILAVGGCKISTSTNSNSTNGNSATANNDANTTKASTPNRTETTPVQVKNDPAAQEQAKKMAGGKEFSAVEVAADQPKNTGGCTCAAKVAIMFQVPDKSEPAFRVCIGKDHPGAGDFAKITPGDLIQFNMADNALEGECADNPGAYLRVKTGE